MAALLATQQVRFPCPPSLEALPVDLLTRSAENVPCAEAMGQGAVYGTLGIP